MRRQSAYFQDFPEDPFPISPDSSMADLGPLLETTPNSLPTADDIPIMLFNDAYARQSFEVENSKWIDSATLSTSDYYDDINPNSRRLTSFNNNRFSENLWPTRTPPAQHTFSTESIVFESPPPLHRDTTIGILPLSAVSISEHNSLSQGPNVVDEPLRLNDNSPVGSPASLRSSKTIRESDSLTPSWISSNDWDYQQYKDFVAQEKGSTSPKTHFSPKTLARIATISIGHQKSSPACDPLINIERSQNINGRPLRVSKSPQKALETPWFRELTVHFLIDQEGFRDAEPSFNFSGISHLKRYDQSSSSESVRVMAQFRPSSRQTFKFHYAPFEGPPVLRRITVNNDDTMDYVTRQVHLPLKSNGVYIAQGYEVVTSDQSKVYWQFEYLVDDRRTDALGSQRSLEGEKTVTPLTFSCSPNFLRPRQGKKINLMHIFKKGVIQKVVAEKLKPPGALPIHSGQEHIASDSLQLHHRTRSQGTPKNNVHPRAVSNRVYPGHLNGISNGGRHPARLRRASSADEHKPKSPQSDRNRAWDIKAATTSKMPSPNNIIPSAQILASPPK